MRSRRDLPLDGDLVSDEPNALAKAIGMLGDEWTLMLVRTALQGAQRYSQFRDLLPISHAVLTTRLDTLVTNGMLTRREYSSTPPRSEYVLTEQGRSVWPVLAAMWGWERRWVPQHTYATPPMRHTVCGQEFLPAFCCRHCGEQVRATDVDTTWGPAGGWRRSVPETSTRRRSDRRTRASAGAFYPDTMAVFGNRWSSAIVGAAFRGVRRYGDFETVLGTPPSLLAQRLAALVEYGILQQVSIESRPDWAEYRLTDKGRDFFPVIALALAWGERWFADPSGPVLDWTHRACGAPLQAELRCDRCHATLHGSEVVTGDQADTGNSPES